ncbi:MAG: hypothetical protein NTZ16_08610 [Verrucomicrobia bacterium]|nr:hypothetical protein [Verrucomicrobiota bacterium]
MQRQVVHTEAKHLVGHRLEHRGTFHPVLPRRERFKRHAAQTVNVRGDDGVGVESAEVIRTFDVAGIALLGPAIPEFTHRQIGRAFHAQAAGDIAALGLEFDAVLMAEFLERPVMLVGENLVHRRYKIIFNASSRRLAGEFLPRQHRQPRNQIVFPARGELRGEIARPVKAPQFDAVLVQIVERLADMRPGGFEHRHAHLVEKHLHDRRAQVVNLQSGEARRILLHRHEVRAIREPEHTPLAGGRGPVQLAVILCRWRFDLAGRHFAYAVAGVCGLANGAGPVMAVSDHTNICAPISGVTHGAP